MGEPAPNLEPAIEPAAESTTRVIVRQAVTNVAEDTAAGAGAGAGPSTAGLTAGEALGAFAVGATLVFIAEMLALSAASQSNEFNNPTEFGGDSRPGGVPEASGDAGAPSPAPAGGASGCPSAGPAAAPAPAPNAPPDPCIEKIQEVRDAINRNKRLFGNRGMHGVEQRYQELIDGPCGPGQRPYRVNSRGVYEPQAVWENHVEEYKSTKRALYNRFKAALDAGCTIPDDVVDDAADAQKREPPDPSQWRGDPNRPCVDSPPPPGWYGPPEAPSTRGL
jgi:hypothetical protein